VETYLILVNHKQVRNTDRCPRFLGRRVAVCDYLVQGESDGTFTAIVTRSSSGSATPEVALCADVPACSATSCFTCTWWTITIVIPEAIDAIRALSGEVRDGSESIAGSNAALGIEASLVDARIGEPVHR
jgi:hypothetical protein